jgi:large subunit ribosomal protein L10
MDNPRPEKAAVVDEVRDKLADADAVLMTEYRGLNVAALADLRRQLRDKGAEYKVYKNTLVRLATREVLAEDLAELLTGPVALTFVKGDAAAVAKALRDYSRTNPQLVLKGGLLGERVISSADVTTLADLPPRDQVLAQLAGLLEAPVQQLASLLAAVPRTFAYGLQAHIDAQGGEPADLASAAS